MTYLGRIVRNTSFLFVTHGLITAVNFVVGIYVLRYLGSNLFGQFSSVFAFLTFFSIFTSNSGLDQILVRELSKDDGMRDFASRVATTVGLRLILAVLGVLLAVGSTAGVYHGDQVGRYICYSSIFLLFNFHENNSPFIVKYNTELRLYVPQLFLLAVHLGAALLRLLFVFGFRAPLLDFILLDAAIPCVISVAYLFLYARRENGFPQLKRFSPAFARRLLRETFPLAVASLLVTIYMRIDQVMISKMLDSVALGNYSVAVRLTEFPNFIPIFIAVSLFPIVSRGQNDPNRWHLYATAYRFLNVLVFPFILFVALFAEEIIGFLFPHQFGSAASALRVLAWSEYFVFAGVLQSTLLLAHHLQRYDMCFVAVQAAVNVALNVVLIPRYGIVGASAATLFSYGLGLGLALLIPSVRPYTKVLVRSSAVFAGISILIFLLTASAQPSIRLVGLAAGIGSFFVLGLHRGDVGLLKQMWREVAALPSMRS